MSNPTVAVVGSTNLDLVFRSPKLPSPGETLLGGEFATTPGGKGGNQAVAIAQIGGGAEFIGCVGADANGSVLKKSLREFGVGIEHLFETDRAASGTAVILVDEAGMNMIVVAAGANMLLSAADVSNALGLIKADVVLAQLEIELGAVEAASKSAKFILNPAPGRHLSDELISRCWAVTPNESEAEVLTGIRPHNREQAEAAANSLRDKGAKNVVLTLGEKGCFWSGESGHGLFPARRVSAVDTTAAGDAFNGAFAWFIAEGREIPEAIELANCVAALSVTKRGAQESMPTKEELSNFAGALL